MKRWILTSLMLLMAAPQVATAQLADHTPPELEEVGVVEHLGGQLPLDLELVAEDGSAVRLGDYFIAERPVILTLNYYKCAMLCTLQLTGLVEGLRELDWAPGTEFEIVTVSINPLETPTLATMKKQTYIKAYGRPEAAAGWHFLTGRQSAIEELAKAVGFGYRYDPESGEYAHPAVAVVSTPDGQVVRYLYGIEYTPRNLRLALVEASEGTVGSPFDQLILFCYHYDPSRRAYAPVAMNIMRVGGGATVLLLAGGLALLWVRDRRRTSGLPDDGGGQP